jgi:hypothetical protein
MSIRLNAVLLTLVRRFCYDASEVDEIRDAGFKYKSRYHWDIGC